MVNNLSMLCLTLYHSVSTTCRRTAWAPECSLCSNNWASSDLTTLDVTRRASCCFNASCKTCRMISEPASTCGMYGQLRCVQPSPVRFGKWWPLWKVELGCRRFSECWECSLGDLQHMRDNQTWPMSLCTMDQPQMHGPSTKARLQQCALLYLEDGKGYRNWQMM